MNRLYAVNKAEQQRAHLHHLLSLLPNPPADVAEVHRVQDWLADYHTHRHSSRHSVVHHSPSDSTVHAHRKHSPVDKAHSIVPTPRPPPRHRSRRSTYDTGCAHVTNAEDKAECYFRLREIFTSMAPNSEQHLDYKNLLILHRQHDRQILQLNDSFYNLYTGVKQTNRDILTNQNILIKSYHTLNASMFQLYHRLDLRMREGIQNHSKQLKSLVFATNLNALFSSYHASHVTLNFAKLVARDFILSRFEQQLNAIQLRKLTPALVNSTYLRTLLSSIQKDVHTRSSEWEVITDLPLSGAYALPDVKFSNTPSHICIQVPVLFHMRAVQPKALYRIESVPVPVQSSSKGARDYTYILDLPSYMGVSSSSYVALTLDDVVTCSHIGNVYYCPGTFLEHTFHSSQIPHCAPAIYFNASSSNIHQVCSVDYHYDHTPPMSLLDGGSHYLLAGLHEKPWSLVCGSTSRVVPLPTSDYVLFSKDQLCHCSLTAGPYFLPRQFDRCSDTAANFSFSFALNRVVYDYFIGLNVSLPDLDTALLSSLTSYQVALSFPTPLIDTSIPSVISDNVLSPLPFVKVQRLNDTIFHSTKPPSHALFPNDVRFVAHKEYISHLLNFHDVGTVILMIVSSVLSLLLTVGLGYGAFRCFRHLQAKSLSPPERHAQDHHRYKKRIGRAASALPAVVGALGAPEVAAIGAALNIISSQAKASAAPIPTFPVQIVSPVPPTESLVDVGARMFREHEIAWTVMFASALFSGFCWTLYNLFKYRSNFLPSLFPLLPKFMPQSLHCRSDLFIHITDNRTGNALVAYLQPIGFPPVDLRTYGSLCLGQIRPVYRLCRLHGLRIDWADFSLYNVDLSVKFPLETFATLSVFSHVTFQDLDSAHVSIRLCGRYLEHIVPVKQTSRVPPLLPAFDPSAPPPTYDSEFVSLPKRTHTRLVRGSTLASSPLGGMERTRP